MTNRHHFLICLVVRILENRDKHQPILSQSNLVPEAQIDNRRDFKYEWSTIRRFL